MPLTPKAFDLLAALLEKPGRLITKEELLQKVWPDTFVEESNLAYNIFALRKALGDTAENSRYIETVPKRGYRFRASVNPASPPSNAQPASEFGAERVTWWPTAKHHQRHARRWLSKLLSRRPMDLLFGRSRTWRVAHLESVGGGAPVQVTDNAGIAIESYAGDLFYLDNVDGPGSIWRLPQDGDPAVKVVDGVVLGNFDVVEEDLYYIDRVSGQPGSYTESPDGETRLRYLDFATWRSTTVATNLGTIGLGLSATRDGRTVFFARVDSSTDELVLVDNFR